MDNSLIENNNPLQEIQDSPQKIEEKVIKPAVFKITRKKIFIILAIILSLTAILYWFFISNKNSSTKNIQVIKTERITEQKESSLQQKAHHSPTPKPEVIITVNKNVKTPFVRDGNIYLYEDGSEELIVQTNGKSTSKSRHDNIYPFLSPNSKYIAYIALSQEADSNFGFWYHEGTLKIYNLETKEIKTTKYQISYYNWNKFNQIEFEEGRETTMEGSKGYSTYVVFDPQTNQEIVREIFEGRTYGFPLYGNKKAIRKKKNNYHLADIQTGKELFLFENKDIASFISWSPDGNHAIFSPESGDKWFDVDTTNLENPIIKRFSVKLDGGGAGGDESTGAKWYFDQGFVYYCTQSIYFINGSNMGLTNSGGGGCHNEEGFVATSPNGEYAFVKFDDRFELHTKNGERKTITEIYPINKWRMGPQNLIWFDNDYMAIFENTNGYVIGSKDEKPNIFLFDRKENSIYPLIKNAYLVSDFS